MNTLQTDENPYYSAEFQLEDPGIFYQMKLRKTDSEPMCALVQKGSRALASIKPGNAIPMIYHFQDKTIPAERKTTRIKYISDGNTIGFKNHFLVALDITPETDKSWSDQALDIFYELGRSA